MRPPRRFPDFPTWSGVLVVVLVIAAVPEAAASPGDDIVGRWRGSSICTKAKGNGNCHDEIVVYDFHRAGGTTDSVTLTADKIVDGKVVPMYDLHLGYDAGDRLWKAEFHNTRVDILWTYSLRGEEIIGTLYDIHSGDVLRNVRVRREKGGEGVAPP